MPKITEPAKNIRLFLAHGVNLWDLDRAQATGDCPFCGREGKLTVETETGLWHCFVCGAEGNSVQFLQRLWTESDKTTSVDKVNKLAVKRGLLYPDTLERWGVCISMLTGEWLIPGYGADGKLLTQLYRYARANKEATKPSLLASAGIGHGLFWANPPRAVADIYVCEGPWDGMALWEVMRSVKWNDEGHLEPTGNEASSLLANAAVVAVPGCNVFRPEWANLLAGRRVFLLYDNDHPREHPPGSGQFTIAGYDGMRRVAGILSQAERKPKELSYLCWGKKDGYDPNLPSGYDVRDAISTAGATLGERIAALGGLLGKIAPVPADWVPGRSRSSKPGSVEVDCLECTSWRDLRQSWLLAMRWTDGLDRALSVMLSSILSTNMLGDPLWVKIIGPASCGKSTLCEALSVSREWIFAISEMRGFHSGWKTDRAGAEDHSLIPLIKGKTLVTKDGDTLLSSVNKEKILSEARDLYDCVARVHYRHGVRRNYDDVRMTWLLCGTESLRALDGSELGERFLDCVIMHEIDEELEDEIGSRKVEQAFADIQLESNGLMESRQNAAMTQAKRLTGGYVNHLRANAAELLKQVTVPPEAKQLCKDLGKFVSFARARPSKRQEEHHGREMSARLIGQLARLSCCLSVVLGKNTVDDEVMSRVRQVALDTARGRTLEIMTHLAAAAPKGLQLATLTHLCSSAEDRKRKYLGFLHKLGIVQLHQEPKLRNEMRPRRYWQLTPRLLRLYQRVTTPTTDQPTNA